MIDDGPLMVDEGLEDSTENGPDASVLSGDETLNTWRQTGR